jgi:tetratricopeptide (TPR) repeat protein
MSLTAGTRLGPYEILGPIGAGGMGEVYHARDTRLGRDVAIKTANAACTQRFEREARTISALNHPHICTLYDVGTVGDTGYIVMELVDGEPIRGPLPWMEAVRHVADVCDALDAAHRRHIVHGDLKPGNVLLTPLGVKVIDFGLAKQQDAGATTETAVTVQGTVIGTVAYMSPEQAAGKPADARSDLWAVGMILVELLSGRLPFRSRHATSILAEIMDPAPLALEFPSDTPPEAARIAGKLLSKDPAERYQHADDAAVDLRGLLRPAAEGSRGGAIVGRDGRGRRRWWWAAAGALALAAALLVGVCQWQRPPTHVPVASKVPEANEQLRLARFFIESQVDLPRAQQHLEKALALDPGFAHARAYLGWTYLNLLDWGLSNDTTLLYKAEAELARALKDDANSALAHAALAGVYLWQGRKELTPWHARRAVELAPDNRAGLSMLAAYHQWSGEYARSQEWSQRLIDIDPGFGAGRIFFAENLRLMGDAAAAIRAHEMVLAQDPTNIPALLLTGMARLTAGDTARARDVLGRARDLEPANYQVRVFWALLLAAENRREEALREMDSEVLKYGKFVVVAANISEFFAVIGDRENALDWLDQAVRVGDERADWFERDPLLANVRTEPRFRAIVDGIRVRRSQLGGAVR